MWRAACVWWVVVSVCAWQHVYATPGMSSEGGVFKLNGQRFHIKGINWFGFETSNHVVHGLWAVKMDSVLSMLEKNKFNALRLPFSLEMCLQTYTMTAGDINPNFNPDFVNKTSWEALRMVIEAAAAHHMLILLDMHSLTPGGYMADGLWYDATHPESMVLQCWDKLAAAYKNQWNVFAIDIKNEPHQSSWGLGNLSTDFNKAAERIGNHVASQTDWLIFVEGVNNKPPCSPNACFWGENLQSVSTAPVTLSVANRLVYSPHVYPQQVADQSYFHAAGYPNNMPSVWEGHWGYIRKQNQAAISIGEWGGDPNKYSDTKVWMEALIAYLTANDMQDQFFWCYNADSGDTGGLVDYDFTTVDPTRLSILNRLQPNPSPVAPDGNPCAGVSCGAHGSCANGQCVCADGFSGAHCEVPPAVKSSSAPVPVVISSTAPSPPRPSSTGPKPPPPSSCWVSVKDMGSNPHWLAFNVQAAAGHDIAAVAAGSAALTGPANWGANGPAVYSTSPAQQMTPPFTLKVTDSAGAFVNVAITTFALSSYSCV